MNPEHTPDPLNPSRSLTNKFDDESMAEKFSTLSKDNKELLDQAFNNVGLDFKQCEAIIGVADVIQRKEISVLLGEVRMTVDRDLKREACKRLAEFLNSI